MLRLQELDIVESKDQLALIPEGKVLINTINAHSYNTAQRDNAFAMALQTVQDSRCMVQGSLPCMKYLIPDGASIIKACRWLKAKSQPKERIAGWDLFLFEIVHLEKKNGKWNMNNGKCLKVMFLGSSEKVLTLIRERAAIDYPNLEIVTYSPPYKPEFSEEDNQAMIQAINDANPDLLWIGMTAPKQEKWTYQHWNELDIRCHCGTIGAVFDFYAGTLNQRKGYADLIRAFAKVAPKHPDWKITLAGNGEIDQARTLANELGIDSQVKLLGWVNRENKDMAYKQASVFCLPSYAEGFPMSVLDAWAYGLPVVTTPVGGIPDVAVDGENMLLFNPGDIDTLAERLDLLMSDDILRDKLAASSIKMSLEMFNLNTITKQVGEIYESFR